jgi:pimeloyl-ACP methyl ester carboxylesterase
MTNKNGLTIDLSEDSKKILINGLADLDDAVSNAPVWLVEALSVPREEGVVEVDGCDIHYFRWGDRSKPAILMLHGFLAHARCFAFIAPFLAKDYHIVAYDHSGMGDSGVRESYPEEARVKEAMGVAQETGLFAQGQKPTLVAHSFGGHVATATVHAHPDRFAGLVICDLMILRPSVLADNAKSFSPPGSHNAGKPNRIYPDYQSAKLRFKLSPPQPVEHQELFDFMAYHSLERVDGGWSWKFDPSVFNREPGFEKKWLQTAEKVATAPGRKAIVYGEQSFLFNADSVDYMHETIAQFGAEDFPMIGIPHARHHLMLDQPIAFVSTLRTILASWHS